LNNILLEDIAAKNIFEVDNESHARFDAIQRSYKYLITTRKDPFELDFAYYVKNDLDVKLMHMCAQQLTSFSNFKSFSKVKTAVRTFNCNVINAQVKNRDHLVIFEITANRFLRNMVRAISGTLIDVGLGKKTIEDFESIIKSQDRRNGKSVPAKGLYLTDIVYPYKLKSIYEQK
jgi:tRNA pseudouridine38-40 synthase